MSTAAVQSDIEALRQELADLHKSIPVHEAELASLVAEKQRLDKQLDDQQQRKTAPKEEMARLGRCIKEIQQSAAYQRIDEKKAVDADLDNERKKLERVKLEHAKYVAADTTSELQEKTALVQKENAALVEELEQLKVATAQMQDVLVDDIFLQNKDLFPDGLVSVLPEGDAAKPPAVRLREKKQRQDERALEFKTAPGVTNRLSELEAHGVQDRVRAAEEAVAARDSMRMQCGVALFVAGTFLINAYLTMKR